MRPLVTVWSFGSSDIAGRIDPRVSFCRLALTEKNLCHFLFILTRYFQSRLQFHAFFELCEISSFYWMKFPLCLLLCSLSTECGSVFVDLACTSLSASFASVWWNFHAFFCFSQARLLSARYLQHLTWRLRCRLLEVGLRYVAASHRLGHLHQYWHLCCKSTTVLCATLIDKKFQVSLFHLGYLSFRTGGANSAAFLTEIPRSLCN